VDYVPICGRCGSEFVSHSDYEATSNYGGTGTGCQNCNPAVRSDRERRVAALLALEREAATGGLKS
jgi:DNA-directed RNA polymerase subunit RPC12/RpoP